MPGPNHVLDKGFVVDDALPKFSPVVFETAQEHVGVASAGNLCAGILQETVTTEDVANGRVANVRVMGIARCVASAQIVPGTRVRAVGSNKVGPLAATTANQHQLGIAMSAAGEDGDHFDVLLTPGATFTTT